jgi:hypothetical protein
LNSKSDARSQYLWLQQERKFADAAASTGLFGVAAALALMLAGERKAARALISVSLIDLVGALCIFAGTKRRASQLLAQLKGSERRAPDEPWRSAGA